MATTERTDAGMTTTERTTTGADAGSTNAERTNAERTNAESVVACRISPTVDLLFSRWTTPILWTLNQSGPVRFVELERRLGSITPKVLTQRLRQLERDGLVQRQYYPQVPPRVEYQITELGRSLSPVFAALAHWTEEHLPAVEHARDTYSGPLPR